MVSFVDAHRDTYALESICAQLPIAPATYYAHRARALNPARRSARQRRDDELPVQIRRVWDANFQVYGPRRVWRHLTRREGMRVARCTVERLMRRIGLRGAVRGRAFRVTTTPSTVVERPLDLVARNFIASRPNQLWVADRTYIATWRGFVYAAFVVDVFARRTACGVRGRLSSAAVETASRAGTHIVGSLENPGRFRSSSDPSEAS
jgi:transposase InsO family protein